MNTFIKMSVISNYIKKKYFKYFTSFQKLINHSLNKDHNVKSKTSEKGFVLLTMTTTSQHTRRCTLCCTARNIHFFWEQLAGLRPRFTLI